MPDFFLVPAPVFTPTACVICSTASDQGGFIDGETEIFGHGHVYLCATCAKQCGARLGMLSAEEEAELREQLAATEARLDEALERLSCDYVLVSRDELDASIREMLTPKKTKAPA